MSSSAAFAVQKCFREYHEVEDCLRDFCAKERNYHAEQARTELLNEHPGQALRYAHQSQVFETWMSEFKHYLENEVRDVQVV